MQNSSSICIVRVYNINTQYTFIVQIHSYIKHRVSYFKTVYAVANFHINTLYSYRCEHEFLLSSAKCFHFKHEE